MFSFSLLKLEIEFPSTYCDYNKRTVSIFPELVMLSGLKEWVKKLSVSFGAPASTGFISFVKGSYV